MAARRRKKKNIRNLKNGEFKLAKKIYGQEGFFFAGVVSLFFAIFFLLSFFKKAGVAGDLTIKLFSFLLGSSVFILPVVFFMLAISFFTKKAESKKTMIVSATAFVLAFSGAVASLEVRESQALTISASKFGGWIGSIFSWPFLRIFGFWMTLIVFFAIIIISLFFLAKFFSSSGFKKKEREKGEIKKEESISAKKVNIKKIFSTKIRVKNIEESSPPAPSFQKGEEKKIEAEGKKKKVEGVKLEKGVGLPPIDLLEEDKGEAAAGDTELSSQIIKRTLENFGIPVEMAGVNIGPTFTQYTLKPAEGIKLSKITTLNNNLALALSSHPIRIEAPIPGKPLVGIEIPNQKRVTVRLKNLFAEQEFQNTDSWLSFGLGRDVVGSPIVADLTKMPHLLVAGSTGTGKTICLNTIILSFLYKNNPKTLRMILIDPKRVEFTIYNKLPHLLSPVVYDASKTVNVLRWLINEMERRFEILSEVGARNIYFYNQKIERNGKYKKEGFEYMPYIVVVVDELADLMAAKGKEIEATIVRLAQKARAVGIHLILATQRPSVEVITGLIKANIIARIAFQVASQIDSRTILDSAGAEKLLGSGDMLFQSSTIAKPRRIQGAYVSEKEVSKVVDYIIKNQHIEGIDELSEQLEQNLEKEEAGGEEGFFSGDEDPLYEEAKKLIIETKKASASFLQRRLRVGYARAARLLDILESRGVIGPAQGAKPREVYSDVSNDSKSFQDLPAPSQSNENNNVQEDDKYEKDYNEEIG